MANNQYFVAKDYLRAFDLKNIFHKYVVIFSQLNYPDGTEPLSNKDRHELNLKLDEAMNEITVLVLKMKESKQCGDSSKKTMLPILNVTNQTCDHRMAN